MNIFIDSNILDVIDELEKLPVKFNYFYPNVDAFQIKSKHLEEIKNKLDGKSYYFYKRINELVTQALEIINDKERFHFVIRPDQTQFVQTFDDNGEPLTYTGLSIVLNENTKNKIQDIYKKLHTITGRTKQDKDLAVLATFIFAGNSSCLINSYDQKISDFSICLGGGKSVYNSDGKKYFISKDQDGVFKQTYIEKIEQEFPDIKIFSLDEFKKDYLKYI